MEQMLFPIRAKYQVFINHRGPDVKKTLASLIYHRLTNCGLSVFLDKNEIQAGDIISSAIDAAIDSSSVHIAIFSENYAESTWCLKELDLMLTSSERGRSKIITVFYDVEPRDICDLKKEPIEGRITQEDLTKWKTALKKASQISGHLFKTQESDHGDFVEEVAKSVLKLDFLESEPVEVTEYPVGLQQAAEDLDSKILNPYLPKATVIVVMAGMVGVGKSTLAKHLYYMKRPEFSKSCLLKDVRKGDSQSLQNKLFHDLLGSCDLQHGRDINKRKRVLGDRTRRFPGSILIVLDDVDGVEDIEPVLDMDALPSGSLILITSRRRGFLKRTCNAQTLVYDVKPLKENHASELFCRHAFNKSKPPEGFKDLVVQSLQFCGGLPFLVKIMGQYFFEKKKQYWKEQLETFFIRPLKGIMEKLKRSFEVLDEDEKEVFLDIGCFLFGEEKQLAIRVLEGLYEYKDIKGNLESLRNKCFVDEIDIKDYLESLSEKCFVDEKIGCRKREDHMIAYNNSCESLKIITMPDPLRQLAINIARQEFGRQEFVRNRERTRLRLSCSNDIEAMSTKTASNIPIWGIRSSSPPAFRPGIRVNAEGVRLFVAEGLVDLSLFFDSWKMSGDLVWLRLGNLSDFLFPCSISLRNLRVLELEGPEDSVQHFFRNFGYDEGRLNGASSSVGRSIFRFWENGKSIFRKWQRRSIFQYLDSRVTGMETLTNLELKNIASLESLPIDFSGLPSLTHLDLSGCIKLTALPHTFSKLSKLQYLALQGCIQLSIPPDILRDMPLRYLNLNGCSKLETLNVEGLTSLKEIKAEACWKLQRIKFLSPRERLNCLHISSHSIFIWKDISEFLASPSQQKPSTAMFSGRVDDVKMMVDDAEKEQMKEKFNVEILDIASTGELENVHSYGAIMMIFISEKGSPDFSVKFKPSSYGSSDSALEYRITLANREGRSLNVFMWTEESLLYKEDNGSSNRGIRVDFSNHSCIQNGWIVMVHKNADVSEVCKELIGAYATTEELM